MEREITTEAATIEEAVDEALDQLGVQQDAVEYEVLEEPGRKLFGLGSEKSARVRVWVKAEYLREIEAGQADEEDVDSDEGGIEPAEEPRPAEMRRGSDEDLTEEQLDQIADTAVAAFQKILDGFGLDASIEEYEGDDGEIILDAVNGDLAVLIGRHGRTLDALQALVSAIVNRQLGFRYPVIIDIEGYRHRRRQKLEDMARRTADRVSRQHAPARMRPMNAYERRVIHVALRDDRRVVTESEGEDPYRQVVIKPR